MEVRAKKALGQHFLTDGQIARRIVDTLQADLPGGGVLEVGPGMGVLTQFLLEREGLDLKAVELDGESVVWLRKHYPALGDGLIEGDFLRMDLETLFPGPFAVIGNFPYNISSQIFFKILEQRDRIPEVVCMIQKEVAERIAEKPGTKTYGILSVFLQAWYDIEYVFSVGPGAFNPPPKVQSAVIRLTRNARTARPCDERLFREMVKNAFSGMEKALVDERELKRGGVSFAIDTVREVAAENPGSKIYFIIGEDSLEGLPKWKDYDELAKLAEFRAYPRTKESSTEIRRLFEEGKAVLNTEEKVVAAVKAGLARKEGFCPCRLPKLPEFFCPCDEFKGQLADPGYHGLCHCRLYLKP